MNCPMKTGPLPDSCSMNSDIAFDDLPDETRAIAGQLLDEQ